MSQPARQDRPHDLFPESSRLKSFRDGVWEEWSAGEIAVAARELGAALSIYGRSPGEAVAVLSDSAADVLLASLAAEAASRVLVPLDPHRSDEDLRAALSEPKAVVAVVEDEQQLTRVRAIRDGLDQLDVVLNVRPPEGRASAALSVADARAAAAERLREDPAGVWRATAAQAAAWIVPTRSGHLPLSASALIEAAEVWRNILALKHDDVVLSRIAVCSPTHAALALGALRAGAVLLHVPPGEGPPLGEIDATVAVVGRPTVEAIEEERRGRESARSWPIRRAAAWARSRSLRDAAPDLAARRLPSPRSTMRGLAGRLGLRRVRQTFGERLRALVSLGPPMPEETVEPLLAAGVPLLEGLDAPEVWGLVSVNLPSALRLGTAGRAVPGLEVAASEDGRLRVRGKPMGVLQGARPPSHREGDWIPIDLRARIDGEGYLSVPELPR